MNYKKLLYLSIIFFIILSSYQLFSYWQLSKEYDYLITQPYQNSITKQKKILELARLRKLSKLGRPYLYGKYCPIHILNANLSLYFPNENNHTGYLINSKNNNSKQLARYFIDKDGFLVVEVPGEGFREKMHIDYITKNKLIIMFSYEQVSYSLLCPENISLLSKE